METTKIPASEEEAAAELRTINPIFHGKTREDLGSELKLNFEKLARVETEMNLVRKHNLRALEDLVIRRNQTKRKIALIEEELGKRSI